MKISVKTFNEKALIKSDLKPFKLTYNKGGKRIWKSENGLQIKALKISIYVYYDVSVINGARLGALNNNGERILARDVQNKVSYFATQFNFNYVKKQAKLIQQSEAGKQLCVAWYRLQKEFKTI